MAGYGADAGAGEDAKQAGEDVMYTEASYCVTYNS